MVEGSRTLSRSSPCTNILARLTCNTLPCNHRSVRDLGHLRRRSACCHAEVEHYQPWCAAELCDALSLTCTLCGEPADDFEVVTGDGEVIWPLPRDYQVPDSFKADVAFLAGSEFLYISRILS